jgi:ribose transport system permease protein
MNGKNRKKSFDFGQKGGLILLAVIICIFFFANTKGLFLSGQNIRNILVSASLNGIIGIGMTFVLITGGIDLSVTGNIIMTSLLISKMMMLGVNWVICLLAALVIGAFVGLVNGVSVGKFGMVAFVVTMAVDGITTGFGKLFTNGLTLYGFPSIHGVFCKYLFGVIPGPVIMMAVVAVIASVILRYTQYGRQLYAVGGNEKAAWMSGMNNSRVIIITYVISGLLCGMGAILMTSKLMSASSTMISGTEMDAIAAAVLGGTSLAGGVGTISGTIIGAITIAMITNGLNLMGVSPFAQEIAKGFIIFAVVAFDAFQKAHKKNS